MLPRLTRSLSALSVAAATLVTATSAHAACSTTASTKAFAKFGDTANYSLLSGANFESGAAGWSLGTGSIVAGNESFAIGTTRDARSLLVPAKARVVSPTFCVGVEHPTFRLFARKASGTWASMLVKLRWTDSRGGVNETTLASLDGGKYASWAPSPSLALATSLPLWQAGQSVTAQLVLDPEDSGGNWQIDDIYVDPLRRS